MTLYPKTIEEMRQGLQAGEFTSVDLTEQAFQAIEALEPKINAMIDYKSYKEEALAAAQTADERGYGDDSPALNGIPVAVKDNLLVQGHTMTAASKMLDGFVAPFDAVAVERLKEAGAIIVGKTNLDEFAMGGSTEHSHYGATHNPWDLDRVSGGSSGGSAASVASRQVPLALGTDTGGSIRQPASFTGIVGMKPTYGLVPRYGAVAMASSFDTVGPMTLTVRDNAQVLNVLAGQDDRDSMSAPQAHGSQDYTEKIGQDIQGLKIAVIKEFMSDQIDPEVRQITEDALDFYRDQGASVEEVSIESLDLAVNLYYILSSAEGSSNMQRYDGIRYGYRAEDVKDLEDLYVRSRSEGLGFEVKRRIMMGMYALSGDHYEESFEQAARIRTLIKHAFARVFEAYDVVLAPTATTPAFEIDSRVQDPMAMYHSDLLTVPANLVGLPALALPAGFTQAGLPVGIQLMGNYHSEALLYQVADHFEQAHDFTQQAPNL